MSSLEPNTKISENILTQQQQEREFNTEKGQVPLDVFGEHAPDQIGMHPQSIKHNVLNENLEWFAVKYMKLFWNGNTGM